VERKEALFVKINKEMTLSFKTTL